MDPSRSGRFVTSAALILLWLVMSAHSGFAQVVYTYVSNKFNLFSCGGDTICSTVNPATTSYTTNDFVTATITLAQPLAGGLNLQDLRGLPGFSLTMYDGHQKMTLDPGVPGEAIVSTDANGRIIEPWSVFVNCCLFPNNNVFTVNWPNVRGVGDGGGLTVPNGSFPNTPRNQGMIFASPGNWIGGTVLSVDDPVYGPGSITRDAAAGLDWLDLTLTQNRTLADVLGQLGDGGQFSGFRHATSTEVFQLFTDAGIPFIETAFATTTPSATNVPSVPHLMLKLGITGGNSVAVFSSGYLADGPAPSIYYTAFLANSPGFGTASASTLGSAGGGQAISSVGHALVRPTSPAAIAASLVSQIQTLASNGSLATDQATGLIDKLNALISSLNRGNKNSSCGQLAAFVNQVNALVRTRALSAATGAQLIASATRISNDIGC